MIIIDIEMPEKCGECPCFHAEYPMHCQLIKPPDKNKRLSAPYGLPRPDWCPLKEQEAVEPTFKQGEDGVFVWACGSCGAYMYHIYDGIDKAKEYAKYCRRCGKKVKWND